MIVGHPYWQQSLANKTVVGEFGRLLPEAVVDNLGVEYPDFKIDVEAAVLAQVQSACSAQATALANLIATL